MEQSHSLLGGVGPEKEIVCQCRRWYSSDGLNNLDVVKETAPATECYTKCRSGRSDRDGVTLPFAVVVIFLVYSIL